MAKAIFTLCTLGALAATTATSVIVAISFGAIRYTEANSSVKANVRLRTGATVAIGQFATLTSRASYVALSLEFADAFLGAGTNGASSTIAVANCAALSLSAINGARIWRTRTLLAAELSPGTISTTASVMIAALNLGANQFARFGHGADIVDTLLSLFAHPAVTTIGCSAFEG